MRVVWLGQWGRWRQVIQVPESIPGSWKEDAVNESLTWLLDMSKTEDSLKTRMFSSLCGMSKHFKYGSNA